MICVGLENSVVRYVPARFCKCFCTVPHSHNYGNQASSPSPSSPSIPVPSLQPYPSHTTPQLIADPYHIFQHPHHDEDVLSIQRIRPAAAKCVAKADHHQYPRLPSCGRVVGDGDSVGRYF